MKAVRSQGPSAGRGSRSDRGCLAAAFALVLAAALVGCGGAPKRTSVPNEARVYAAEDPFNQGRSAREFAWEDVRRVQPISFCYGRPLDDAPDLRAEAEYICKGGTVEYYGQDVGLRRCPLFQPYRMTFICFPAGSLESSVTESAPAE